MLNRTDADRPYVEALVAMEVVTQALHTERFQGSSVWESLSVIASTIQVAWVANRLARLRDNMAARAR